MTPEWRLEDEATSVAKTDSDLREWMLGNADARLAARLCERYDPELLEWLFERNQPFTPEAAR
jgi:hypothetical protein